MRFTAKTLRLVAMRLRQNAPNLQLKERHRAHKLATLLLLLARAQIKNPKLAPSPASEQANELNIQPSEPPRASGKSL